MISLLEDLLIRIVFYQLLVCIRPSTQLRYQELLVEFVRFKHESMERLAEGIARLILMRTVDHLQLELAGALKQQTYPGGPQIDRMAPKGTPGRFKFPRPLKNDPRIVFSFSGLKTAVRVVVDDLPRPLSEQTVADVSYELQEAIVDSLCHRLFQAARRKHVPAVYLAGGVSANGRLRGRVAEEAKRLNLHFVPPEPVYCTDNAAMIAYAGWCHFASGRSDGLDLDSFPRKPLTSWR